MRECFELQSTDGLARVGELTVPRADATVETPALLPVVNPNRITIPPADFTAAFGLEALITNAYIIHQTPELRDRARSDGLRSLLDFDGVVVTDSGSFQLAAYGEIDVDTREILSFQREIGSHVGTPVDIPTPPDVDRERAERELETTRERLEIAEAFDAGEMLLTAPIQGSTHADLRERAAAHAYATSLDVFPVGAVVPLLEDYRYDDVVEVVLAAKRGLGGDAPVHLFGAGHPMMFALGAAAGCDLFDSAAYAIYARDDRYLTVAGTRHLADLAYLPCACSVCAETTPEAIRELPDADREATLARHNLHVSVAEIRRVRQAIRSGTLFELVERRARAHPALLDGYRALLEHTEQLERRDPVSKGSPFVVSPESASRPEVRRHHDRLGRLRVPDRLILSAIGRSIPPTVLPEPWTEPTPPVWRLVPPFGPVPPALSNTYPLTAEVPDRSDGAARAAAAEAVAALQRTRPEAALLVVHDGWHESVREALPDGVATVDAAELSPSG